MLHQLYAAIHEWHSGRHHTMDFSTNAYLDVYQGHIDTFHYIQENRPCALHVMMSDIYSQARLVFSLELLLLLSLICHCTFSTMDSSTTAVPIANIDIEELEG